MKKNKGFWKTLLGVIFLIAPFIIRFLVTNIQLIQDFYMNYIHFNDIWSSYYSAFSILVNLWILNFYLYSHNEIIMKHEEENYPLVTLRVISKNNGLIYLRLKNAGNNPAYNVNINLKDDLEYKLSPYKTLNSLPMFQNLSILEKEEIEIFYDSSYEFFSNKKNIELEIDMVITYYLDSRNNNKKIVESKLSFKEIAGILYVSQKNMGDLVRELSEIKHGLLINSINPKGDF
ncbi:MAG: hypothetical protein ACRCZR_08180 [Cetobacterium sp.]